MYNKRFSLGMYDDAYWTEAEYPGWDMTIHHGQACIELRFRPFNTCVKCNDERDGLWDLESVEFLHTRTPEEIRDCANLVKRITKDLGLGKWHMLPHNLISHGYKPFAERYPAKYVS